MTYATIHLHLTPHPVPTPTGAIDYACDLAKALESNLNVSSSRLTIRAPTNWLVAAMLERMTKDLEAKVASETRALQSHLEARAAGSGVQFRITHVDGQWPVGQLNSSWRGRVSDLCVLGLASEGVDPRLDIEDWLFGSGRPCILYPDKSKRAFSLENVLICWDFSRSAARTVSDALPIFHNATNVHVAVFQGEKDLPVADPATPLIEFLGKHGVSATSEEVEIGDSTIGQAVLDKAKAVNADLIVMGAFGHSSLREFFLGGATKEVLDRSTIPLLMSH